VATGSVDELSILIVDDSVVNVRLLEAILKRSGHDADTALSAAEAIARYRKNPPDVIFMDIHMPGMDGMAAVRQIREIERETGGRPCTIVAVTADLLMEGNGGAPAEGMDGYLNKPLKVPEVTRILAWIAERRKP
jgi:CheY-like chemotaxis protein